MKMNETFLTFCAVISTVSLSWTWACTRKIIYV